MIQETWGGNMRESSILRGTTRNIVKLIALDDLECLPRHNYLSCTLVRNFMRSIVEVTQHNNVVVLEKWVLDKFGHYLFLCMSLVCPMLCFYQIQSNECDPLWESRNAKIFRHMLGHAHAGKLLLTRVIVLLRCSSTFGYWDPLL